MTKRPKKSDKSLAQDLDFDEALGRFAQVAPPELVRAEPNGPVRLQQDDTGARFLIYATDKGVRHELRYDSDQPWFTQKQLADMFGVDISVANRHIANFIGDGELDPTTFAEFAIVQTEGGRRVTRPVKHYGLDVAFYVGYRVNSTVGVLFRKWATAVLVQFATKGFVIDKESLRAAPDAKSRTDEIKDILQDLRSDQASVHRELDQICAQCQDYAPKDPNWRRFFRETSAAIFYAAVQQTPSEVIFERADAKVENMGLITFPKARVWKSDVTVGKNYLGKTELDDLNRFSSLLLDFILDQARSGRMTTMDQARAHIVRIIETSGRRVLKDGGSVLRKHADEHAEAQYEIFDAQIKSDRQTRGDRLFDDSDRDV